ncbi:MAG: hypothetical protein BWZ10_02773 [candidate division BRC1 bacterium ADurb.BinA364]|nr:MAG: hypothetical protein BWZ10_02773 [candidate division BRC1 bacterium ADurb.BinA364]
MAGAAAQRLDRRRGVLLAGGHRRFRGVFRRSARGADRFVSAACDVFLGTWAAKAAGVFLRAFVSGAGDLLCAADADDPAAEGAARAMADGGGEWIGLGDHGRGPGFDFFADGFGVVWNRDRAGVLFLFFRSEPPAQAAAGGGLRGCRSRSVRADSRGTAPLDPKHVRHVAAGKARFFGEQPGGAFCGRIEIGGARLDRHGSGIGDVALAERV